MKTPGYVFGTGVVASVSIGAAAYDSEPVAVVLGSGMAGSNALLNEGVVIADGGGRKSPSSRREEQKSVGVALAEPVGDEFPSRSGGTVTWAVAGAARVARVNHNPTPYVCAPHDLESETISDGNFPWRVQGVSSEVDTSIYCCLDRSLPI